MSIAIPVSVSFKAARPDAFVPPPTVDVWGLPFSQLTLEQSLDCIGQMIADGDPRYLITANLNYVMLADGQPDLWPVNRDAALILADGQPIVWRSKAEMNPLPERVAGSEMIYRLGERSAREGWSLYLLGAAEGVAQACADGLCERYPGCRIAGVESPPFRKLTADEEAAQQERIRAARPDILLVAFGQPKGERWIYERYQQLGVPVSIQLGASFDFVAGAAKRAPKFFQKTGLEWAYRMAHDPRRLVPRYAGNAAFLAKALLRDVVK
ncbi:WecB/TagA/CpsF family glycosyltransferase [Roseimaritima ulvae]|uniref:N-acetylmannosaminyltransferase n=1 Tax=Roseimaritima ulvae TaxID=980254 RepID=A0A5B9QX58_9BACT|nr:WecB/TagA/CpsF family glycosyltransferase [Roseimaritima ulvae]QEG38551.1 Putative N-acetylmannosaminyltransferase [Roseimaritima ulvae]